MTFAKPYGLERDGQTKVSAERLPYQSLEASCMNAAVRASPREPEPPHGPTVSVPTGRRADGAVVPRQSRLVGAVQTRVYGGERLGLLEPAH